MYLLNKMAKDANYKPSKVMHRGVLYEYSDPCYVFGSDNVGLFGGFQIERFLNDEIEIIEDKPKHIEELIIGKENTCSLGNGQLRCDINVLVDKVNEISKSMNYLLEKHD